MEVEPAAEFDRSPPIAMFLCGESFFKAATHLEDSLKGGTLKLRFQTQPIYYLYHHAVELVLKAFLKSAGVSARTVRAFQHRISEIYEECLKHSLPQTAHDPSLARQVIRLLSEANEDQALRYVKVGFTQLPDPGAVRYLMDGLLSDIRPCCPPVIMRDDSR